KAAIRRPKPCPRVWIVRCNRAELPPQNSWPPPRAAGYRFKPEIIALHRRERMWRYKVYVLFTSQFSRANHQSQEGDEGTASKNSERLASITTAALRI